MTGPHHEMVFPLLVLCGQRSRQLLQLKQGSTMSLADSSVLLLLERVGFLQLGLHPRRGFVFSFLHNSNKK